VATARKIRNARSWGATLKAASKHTMLQGEVVHAANLLHDNFFAVFAIALALERPEGWTSVNRFHNHANAIWHSVSADSAQREMSLAAISTVPTQLALRPAISRLNWAKKRAAKLAEYRDLLAHNPVMFRAQQKGKKLVRVASFGGYSTRPGQRARLELMGGLSLWRTIRNDLLNLSAYVGAVHVRIQQLMIESTGASLIGVPNSWPERPRLRSLPRLQEIERRSTPARPKPKRRTRRRPSRK
jgi:hypothetical protein